MSTDEEPTATGESRLVTYVVPFLGVLLIAVGIPAAILGGYVVMQDALGLCGEPDLTVSSVEEPDETPPSVDTLAFEELSPAEKAAVEAALDSPLEEATVEGPLENEEALLAGVVIEADGEAYYVAITSLNSCLETEPLLFPIGAVGILVGVAGVLTPPIYRRMAGFEERMRLTTERDGE